MLRTLSDHTGPQLSILPGSGINADNIHDLLRELPNLTEIHLTASEAIATDHGRDHPDSGLDDDLARFGFGPDQLWTLNEDKIRAVFEIIDDVGRTAEDE
jgi:copper homeostasis protein CutC